MDGLTILPARPVLCAGFSFHGPCADMQGRRSHGASFSGRDLREGGGMGQISLKAGFPPRASMTSEVSPEQACLSETCQALDDPVLPLLFGLTWNSHHELLLGLKKGVFSRARLLKCTRKGKALTSTHTNTDSSIRLDVEKQNSETSRMACWMGACWWVRRRNRKPQGRRRCHPGPRCSGDFPGASSTGAAVCQKLTAGDLWRPLCSSLQANTKSNCCLFLSEGSFLRLKWVL